MWDLKHDTDEANSQMHKTDPQTPDAQDGPTNSRCTGWTRKLTDAQDGPVGSKGVAEGLGFTGANCYTQAGQTGSYCTGQGPVLNAP